jgi:hypothetical protein
MKRIAVTLGLGSVLALCAVALASTALSGTYTAVLGKSTGKLAGSWGLTFASPKYTVTDAGKTVITGTYTLSGNKITLTDKSGADACPGKGVYQYTESGRSLTFKRVSDTNAKCVGRRTVLASTFTKKFSSTGSGGSY